MEYTMLLAFNLEHEERIKSSNVMNSAKSIAVITLLEMGFDVFKIDHYNGKSLRSYISISMTLPENEPERGEQELRRNVLAPVLCNIENTLRITNSKYMSENFPEVPGLFSLRDCGCISVMEVNRRFSKIFSRALEQ